MKNLLKSAAVVMLCGGVLSSFILAVRALSEGPSVDLFGPAIAVAAFIVPAIFLSIPLIDPPCAMPVPPPLPWDHRHD